MAGKLPVSPLAPEKFPTLPVIDGVRFAALEAGVRYSGRADVMLAELCEGTAVAGVFTRSSTRSAAVLDCQEKITEDLGGRAAILVNSGNSNAFTGHSGFDSVAKITAAVAETMSIDAKRVFTASTGVIGEPIKWERITAKIGDLNAALEAGAMENAARAIMTTDTFPKGATKTATLDGVEVKIAGFAKGSGMIAPDMATMLCYIFTDAAMSREVLQQCLWLDNASTFNCVTVDGDTSTSDTVLVAATGKADMEPITDFADPRVRIFRDALHAVMKDLAIQIARDGEGATKLIEVQVTGANANGPAHRVAMAIANSPLVKTAVAGEDPNWGRIVMAVGKAGERAERDRLTIWFGDILVAENGWVAPSYTEEAGAAYMKRDEIVIRVDLGLDNGTATVWSCDLTHGYISINADYRS
ncbi:Arginine biosynthesis bifunctional protein ArgJ [Thalassovita gelatinovora]|uniref:Arginine biosynthesis bifunctional protein ArgJ n=1 Tax=Thalassovita gelatinovora TaxID=53501 RepID=A0A0P1F9R4_THAGE|nr:bifunctional glutamate N-acetyltransferase/amino-acid acetyltransferase ArgJ [Thalassovita gelatinovora]QIZ81098.1 bifunctional glutamate N-acetyltransferase/amino-acid acetyltransferase ArgJ [Thalassovita gelatinovora]CUH64910.1 Arginine biosynthesis bifunctional protein ArgJ [Thalassovita gelatinovora]SEP89790.1 glutamate N-acetyltransferase [Thalassovita gelatinovora]